MTRAIKRSIYYLVGLTLIILVIDLSGVLRHPFEKDYFTQFSYPLDLPNFASVVKRYSKKELTAYDPINLNYANLKYIKTANSSCTSDNPFRLILLVKSTPSNFEKRLAIRQTWGYQKRFSDVPIKTVFLLGIPSAEEQAKTFHPPFTKSPLKLMNAVNAESDKFGDIILADFVDSYYNNTYKTMMGMRWLVESCPNFRYVFFSDDDMYVSVKNLLKFLRHPTSYPEYWENQKLLDKARAERQFREKQYLEKKRRKQLKTQQLTGLNTDRSPPKVLQHENALIDEKTGKVKVWKNSGVDFDVDLDADVALYAGYVYFLPPYRHKLGSKWYLALDEYPYNYLPPFVPAGSVALSKSSLTDIYYASLFTKHLRFDDVFIAICAKKMGIEPYHSEYFRVSPSYPVMDRDDVKLEYLITWHGFDKPETLIGFWNAQKSSGNA